MQLILECIVGFFVVCVAGYGFWNLRQFYNNIYAELNDTIQFIEENITKNPLLMVFPLLEERLTKTSFLPLAAAWREFDASLIKTEKTISTTVRAENYFNEHSLVDGPLKADLLRNIPGILTGLGIVGTFLGVITGLHGYDSQDLASVRTSISHLLQSVQGAFIISFVAVLLSILFTAVEKWFTSKLYVLVARFQQSLGRIFSHSVSDEYLQRMVEQLEEQGSALRSFSHDLSESIKISLSELVEHQNATLRENNLQFAETVKQALVEELSPTMKSLAEVMEKVQQTQSEAGQSVIQQMVAEFKETLNGSSNQQIQSVTSALEGTAGLLSGVQQEMHSLIRSLREEGSQQKGFVSNQLEKLTTQSIQQQQVLEERMSRFINEVQENTKQWQEQLSRQQSESVVELKNGIEPLISSIGKAGQAIFTQSIEQQQVLEGRMTAFVNQIEANMQNWQQDLGKQQSYVITEINNGIHPLLSSMELSGKVMVDKLEQAAVLLQQERDYLEQSMLRSKDILEKLQNIFEDSCLTGKHWKESAAVFQSAGELLESVNQQFKESHLLLNQSVSGFEKQLQQTGQQIALQRSVIEEYQSFSQQMKAEWVEQRKTIVDLDTQVQDDMKTFAEVSSKALREYLIQVDSNLDKIVQSIRGLVEPLQESVDELSDILEQQNNGQQLHQGR